MKDGVISQDRSAARRERLQRRLRSARVDALLVTSPVNVRYLTGFTGEDSYLLVGRGLAVLITDSRFETQVSLECPRLDAYVRPRIEPMSEAAARIVKQSRLSRLGFESHTTRYSDWEAIAAAVKPLDLVPLAGEVEALRVVKDADEIREIREAVRQAERGFELLKASLRAEMTEREAANELEYAMRRFGARDASFETIVAAGSRAALPHARPTAARLGDSDFLLVDWGATNAAGYRSDLTRLLVTATISPKLEKLYKVVLNAQRAGIEAVRPGVLASQVDERAREVIARAGLAKVFGHGLGHGIGLEIHEGPRVSQNGNVNLKPGMVITIEPGVYLPGWGGIRIEDDVLVTRSGHECLSTLPRDLQTISLG